jgi:transposase-like protein
MATDLQAVLTQWDLTPQQVRERLYQAPTPRERERWHAVWLVLQGWAAAAVARALERDPHTIGAWLDEFRRDGPAARAFEHTGGPPPPPSTRSARRR